MRKRGLRFAAAIALAAAVAAGPAEAGKPGGGGGGGTGGGTIWFNGDNQRYTMNSDGTGKAITTTDPQFSEHGGHRWTFEWTLIAGEYYPDGKPRREATAVRDDGVAVALTSQADLQYVGYIQGFSGTIARCNPWVPDGLRIAWLARRWVSGSVAEGGLYVAELAFDGSGNITGLVSQPAAPSFSRPLVTTPPGGLGVTPNITVSGLVGDIFSFSFSPDASRFAYDNLAGVDLADLSGGDTFLVAGTRPLWSPDGVKILYHYSGGAPRPGYRTINTDGSGIKTIFNDTVSSTVYGACWSPTGSHIAYTRYFNGSNFNASSVERVASSGETATNLTPEFNASLAAGWTQ